MGTLHRREEASVIVLTLARNPINVSVARNALRYGTGSLNIDAGRVGYEDTQNAATNPLFRKRGGYKMQSGMDAAPSSYVLRRGPGEINPNEAGCWPANVILRHLPGCRKMGQRTVKVNGPSPDQIGLGREGNWTRGIYGAKASKVTTAYASEDGTKVIEAWDCQPGCPVAGLDRQSGKIPTQRTRTDPTSKLGNPNEALAYFGLNNRKTRPPEYLGETGGASRFFKQVGGEG